MCVCYLPTVLDVRAQRHMHQRIQNGSILIATKAGVANTAPVPRIASVVKTSVVARPWEQTSVVARPWEQRWAAIGRHCCTKNV